MSAFDNQVSVGLLVNPTLAIKAGASPTVKSSNAFQYIVSNVLVNKAAGDMPALTGTIPASYSSTYVFYGDSSGTITVVKGNNVSGTSSGIIAISDILPQGSTGLSTVTSTLACIGMVTVVNGTASTFTGGTTALDTASLTVYYSNFPISGL